MEWAPGAKEIYLVGDFNNWNKKSHPLKRIAYGNWSIQLDKNEKGEHQIPSGSKIRLYMLTAKDKWVYKIPAWCKYAI